MSFTEELCRWSIVEAYILWKLHHGIRPLNVLAYCRAVGLDIGVAPHPLGEEAPA